MVAAKTATLTIDIDPDVKESRPTAAVRKNRSIANTVAVLSKDFAGSTGS